MVTDDKVQNISGNIEDDLSPEDYAVNSVRAEGVEERRILTDGKDMGSIFADNVKVMTDDGTRICTFVFYKKHVKAMLTKTGIEMETIFHEPVMEVKVPYNSAFQLALYMNEVFKNIKNGERGRIRFGPKELM